MMPYHFNRHIAFLHSRCDFQLVSLTMHEIISVDNALRGAFYRGLSASTNLTSAVDVTCRTGNCTWPDFASLGVCSTCHNVTADSIVVDSGNSVEVPEGLTLKFINSSKLIVPGSEGPCGSIDGCDLRMITPLATNITQNGYLTANIVTLAVGQLTGDVAYMDLTNRKDWRAFYCSLDLCIKRYSKFTVVLYYPWRLK